MIGMNDSLLVNIIGFKVYYETGRLAKVCLCVRVWLPGWSWGGGRGMMMVGSGGGGGGIVTSPCPPLSRS